MSQTLSDIPATVNYLLSPQAIRDRSQILFDRACADQLDHFRCDLNQLPAAADYVIGVMQQQYPAGDIPVHSRWRHFEVEGQSRLALMEPDLSHMNAMDRARLKVDLAIVSVLLDAGAGSQWQYVEPKTGKEFRRSEGLAIASFHSFYAGLFSSIPNQPWQANAEGLSNLTPEALPQAFQVSDDNPLVGIGGRTQLLQQLGQVLQHNPEYFGHANPRPGGLVDYWLKACPNKNLPAGLVLTTILRSLGDIWPGRIELNGTNLGDVWPHPKLPAVRPGDGLVPFHKLSQWLTYSLLEPLAELGLPIVDLDALTGLAEYRNGGLLIDTGVLVPKRAAILSQPQTPGSPAIVEWRALTVILLDRLADQIRHRLNQSVQELPLPKILQGGTWAAGRQLARENRPNGAPPIQIVSDGTVF
jgi:hypothetical protein